MHPTMFDGAGDQFARFCLLVAVGLASCAALTVCYFAGVDWPREHPATTALGVVVAYLAARAWLFG